MYLREKIDLTGNVAIVTGAGRGLGKAICLELASAGVDIVLVARTAKEITEVGDEVKALGRMALPIQCDVREKSQVDAVVDQAIKKFGKIDILVNNSGSLILKRFLDFTDEDWQFTLDVNLRGTFLFCQAAGKHMVEQKYGKIINISSADALHPIPWAQAYCAAKAGLIGFTKSLASEWAKHSINVNAIAPGYFDTNALRTALDQDKVKVKIDDIIKKYLPMQRMGDDREIAAAVAFLASPASNYITGIVLTVDGGYLIQNPVKG